MHYHAVVVNSILLQFAREGEKPLPLFMLAIAGVVVFVLFVFVYLTTEGAGRALLPDKLRNRLYPDRRNSQPHDYQFYETHFTYFKVLGRKEQDKFIHRITFVRNTKEFKAAAGIVLDDEKINFICGSLVKLTFGYRTNYHLPGLLYIIIHPDVFYSQSVGQEVKGLTKPADGIIYLSWKHFEEGYANAKDKINLGLHELAHALMIEMENFQFDDSGKWRQLAHNVMEEMERNPTHFFRPYGATNIHEFWAVCVETFFETPLEFRKQFPLLYIETCHLLKQDYAARLSMFEREKFMGHGT